jgi:hypothetical protein
MSVVIGLLWAASSALTLVVVRRITGRQQYLFDRDGPVGPPAAWYPDPLGRYEYRYWDGRQWTADVSRQGQVESSPIA